MKTEKPTPIPKRASNPQPLQLPKQPTIDERIEATVRRCLYQLMRSEEQINILEMTYEEFEAFWQKVMEAE